MSYADERYPSPATDVFAAQAAASERAGFITKTYLHLAAAIGAFALLEAILLNMPGIDRLIELMVRGRYSWLIVMALFMGVSYVADQWARSATSPTMQYLGLSLYVVAEAVIFAPLLYVARAIDSQIIPAAAVGTFALFGVMTLTVFLTRKDFSFLRSILVFGGVAAIGLIVASVFFQFALGPIFTYAMIAFACAWILYDTSNVLHHYRIGQHVAAALALFASVALLFWYILRLMMSARD